MRVLLFEVVLFIRKRERFVSADGGRESLCSLLTVTVQGAGRKPSTQVFPFESSAKEAKRRAAGSRRGASFSELIELSIPREKKGSKREREQ